VIITEQHIQTIWKNRIAGKGPFILEDGKKLVVNFPGIANKQAGPDFICARFKVNNIEYQGDVEVHLYTDDWKNHAHFDDFLYSNVLLHVALWRSGEYEIKTNASGKQLFELVLEPYLKTSIINIVKRIGERKKVKPVPVEDVQKVVAKLDLLGEQRFKSKAQYFANLLPHFPSQEILYRGLMIALGYKNNKPQFHQISKTVPYSDIKKLSSCKDIENVLFSALPSIAFRKTATRPANIPEKRLKAAAKLLANISQKGLLETFKEIIEDKTQQNTLCKKLCLLLQNRSGNLIGKQRAYEIIFNVLLPFFYSYYKGRDIQKKIFETFCNHKPLKFDYLYRLLSQKIFTGWQKHQIKSVIKKFKQEWGVLSF
jgi:hypothetical protein